MKKQLLTTEKTPVTEERNWSTRLLIPFGQPMSLVGVSYRIMNEAVPTGVWGNLWAVSPLKKMSPPHQQLLTAYNIPEKKRVP